MVIDRYKGFSAYRMREVQYRVYEDREEFHVYDERTGKLAFRLTAFYNPKRIIRPGDKEGVLGDLMQTAVKTIRDKIDRGDHSDAAIHVESVALTGGKPIVMPHSA